MKNLSTQEKKDLDICVFSSLGKDYQSGFLARLQDFFTKIKGFLNPKDKKF